MQLFQALRRSIKGEKDKLPQINLAPKSAVAIVPPKKVNILNPPSPFLLLAKVLGMER